MTTFLTMMAYAGLGLWIVVALMRVQAAWETSQFQANHLRKTLTASGLKLLGNLETIQKLEDEIKRVNDGAVGAAQDQKDRHAAFAKSAPPPPPEVYVTSEYPASRRDTAWVVSFSRHSELPPQPWEREPNTSLVWAGTPAAAHTRARQLTEEYKTYSVANVRPLL